jgi:hypothetical protein
VQYAVEIVLTGRFLAVQSQPSSTYLPCRYAYYLSPVGPLLVEPMPPPSPQLRRQSLFGEYDVPLVAFGTLSRASLSRRISDFVRIVCCKNDRL